MGLHIDPRATRCLHSSTGQHLHRAAALRFAALRRDRLARADIL